MAGFGSGFSQGLNSVNSLFRTLDNRKYQDEMIGLRQTDQAIREHEYDQNQQFRRDSLTQQKQMHDDTLGLQWNINKANRAMQRIGLGIKANQAAFNQRQAEQQQLAPVFQQALAIAANGGDIPPAMMDKLSGTPFDIGVISGVPFRVAVKNVTDILSKDPDKINTPKGLEDLNTVLAAEANTVAGQVDPGTGKTMAGRQITGVIPSPDGKWLVPKFQVTYTDGSKQDDAPLSKYGTTHPDDPLIAIPRDQAGQQMFARKAASAILSYSPNMKALAGSGKDSLKKEAFGKVADLEKERVKKNVEIRNDPTNQGKGQEYLQSQIEANDKDYRDAEGQIYNIYGTTSRSATDDAARTANDEQRQQIQSDPVYADFRDSLRGRQNPVDVEHMDTQDLGELFQAYKDSLVKNKHASTMAEQMRQNYARQGQ